MIMSKFISLTLIGNDEKLHQILININSIMYAYEENEEVHIVFSKESSKVVTKNLAEVLEKSHSCE